jgi:small-conductance mechanosensitive channel
MALLPAGALAGGPSDGDSAAPSEARLRVFNRDIVTFRASLMGVAAEDRARRAKTRIEEQLEAPGAHAVSLQSSPAGSLVQIDGATSFIVTADDADRLQQETEDAAARRAATALGAAIEATRESRSLDAVVRSLAITAAATAAMLALLWLLRRARLAVERWVLGMTSRQTERLRVSGVALIRQERLAWLVHAGVMALHRIVLLLLIYEWISLVLAQFPYTRVWSEHLNGYLFGLAAGIGGGILETVPGVFTAIVIFFLARFAGRMVDGFFERVQSGQMRLNWLDADVAAPTRRIAKAAVWLFALAMAYPYLPGARTEAFKGLSVLLGLMISLGASNLVGQAGSGLILTYARVFRRGEYVRIADHEGTVMDLGMFATRIRTGLGEELTLSNSLVLGAVTKNYSRAVKGPGYVVDTTVTIGYDTPWRQVHAMLIDAAHRTPGVLASPAPQVFQTALSDFYPEYRLVCQAIPSEPRPRAQVLSALHANIQDVFSEFGVQIMSPHYVEDPAAPKTVAPERWSPPPADEARA